MRRLLFRLALGGAIGALASLGGCSSDDPAPGGAGGAGGGGGGGAAGAAPGRNAQCTTRLGAPAIDRAGTCVALTSPDCPNVVGPIVEDDNAVLLGSLFSLSGPNQSSGVARQNSIELAVRALNDRGGLPPAAEGGALRPLAFVGCDEARPDPANAGQTTRVAAAKHLVSLGVAAVIGAGASGATIDVATNGTLPAKTLLISPSSTAIAISSLPGATVDGERLVWRTAPSDTTQAEALRASLEGLAGAGAKVAVVHRNDAYGKGLSSALASGLTLGGAPATAENLVDIEYDGAKPPEQLTDAVDALAAFGPTVVVLVGTAEAITGVLVPYEARLEAGAARPQYLISDGGRRDDLVKALGASPDPEGLRTRVRGTSPGVPTVLAQNFFNLVYKRAFPESPQLIFGMAGAYDAAFLLAYAAVAAGDRPLDGPAMAAGLRRTVGGALAINAGASDANKAFEELRQGRAIDFNGASGPLEFDPASGEAASDINVWCVGVNPNDRSFYLKDDSKQYYDATARALTGAFACE
ncbi:MAG TPA: ABC transporter substrate-binding protein [Polyangiaceae bacterium]|nr:ABC transporter substrate-binding protein [Polyangiaceae bacterium]